MSILQTFWWIFEENRISGSKDSPTHADPPNLPRGFSVPDSTINSIFFFITKILSHYYSKFKLKLPVFFACSCLLVTRYTFLRLNYDSSIFLHLVINNNILLSFTINREFIKSLITPSVLNEILFFFCSVYCSYCGAQKVRSKFSHLTVVRKL
jgi:hypothetical protein